MERAGYLCLFYRGYSGDQMKTRLSLSKNLRRIDQDESGFIYWILEHKTAHDIPLRKGVYHAYTVSTDLV